MGMERAVAIGAGGVVFGLLLGWLIGGSGDVSDEVAALTGKVTALETQVGSLGGKVDGIQTAMAEAESASSGQMQALAASLDGVKSDIGGALSGLGGQVSTALSGNLNSLRKDMASLISGSGGGAPAAGTPIDIGAVADFDDKVRVFVSGLDESAKSARVAINGTTLTTLSLGTPVEANGCQVSLTGFTPNGAVIDAAC